MGAPRKQYCQCGLVVEAWEIQTKVPGAKPVVLIVCPRCDRGNHPAQGGPR